MTSINGIFSVLYGNSDPLMIEHSIAVVAPFSRLQWFPQGQGFKQWTGDNSKVLTKVGILLYNLFYLHQNILHRSTCRPSKAMFPQWWCVLCVPSWSFAILLVAMSKTQKVLQNWRICSIGFISTKLFFRNVVFVWMGSIPLVNILWGII